MARPKDCAYLPGQPPNLDIVAHICNHDIDFLLVHPDNSIELVEIKSQATKTDKWRLKLKLLEATLLREHPEIRYTVQ